MSDLLWRIIYAVICVILLLAALPLFFTVVGFHVAGPLWQLVRICIVGIAVLYVLRGRPLP